MDLLNTFASLFSNFGNLTWQMVVMWGIGALLIYLAIAKKMEPSLLLPMGFGAILVNLPLSGAITQGDTVGPISALFEAGMSNELFPLLLFIGIGAMIDFGPLLEKPWLMLFGAAAQFGIFFTLFLSLLAMWGLTTRRWWLFVLGVLVLAFGSFDYNYNGVILMLIFYFCRNKPALLAGLYILFWLPALWGGSLEDPLALVVGGHAVNWTIFGLLALPLILCRTHSGIRIPKWFFYAFYPAHLAIIALVGWCMGV